MTCYSRCQPDPHSWYSLVDVSFCRLPLLWMCYSWAELNTGGLVFLMLSRKSDMAFVFSIYPRLFVSWKLFDKWDLPAPISQEIMLGEMQMYMMVAFKSTTVDMVDRDRDMFVLLATSNSLVVDMSPMSPDFWGSESFGGHGRRFQSISKRLSSVDILKIVDNFCLFSLTIMKLFQKI